MCLTWGGDVHNQLSFLPFAFWTGSKFSYENSREFQVILDISTCSVVVLPEAILVLLCVSTSTLLSTSRINWKECRRIVPLDPWRSLAFTYDLISTATKSYTCWTNCGVLILSDGCEWILSFSTGDTSPLEAYNSFWILWTYDLVTWKRRALAELLCLASDTITTRRFISYISFMLDSETKFYNHMASNTCSILSVMRRKKTDQSIIVMIRNNLTAAH